jgi:molybdopterin/thiamine biosynthesis adenylyltransferase
VITLSADVLTGSDSQQPTRGIRLTRWDNGEVYNSFFREGTTLGVQGSISRAAPPSLVNVETIGLPEDEVRIVVPEGSSSPVTGAKALDGESKSIRGFVRRGQSWIQMPVQVVSLRGEISSRSAGILETDVFADREVFLAGLGSGGAQIAGELAKLGVGRLTLVDHDRLEVGNIGRHLLGLSQVGRYKVDAMVDAIRDKNPFVRVRRSRSKISRETIDEIRVFVQQADVVICAIDDPAGKRLLNRICVQENKSLIIAGVFRRAYGGQILCIHPHRTLCYQCFLMNLPEAARDQEVSSLRDAQRIAYSDRVVPIEPGLSNDIAPVSTMVVTLTIQELLKDKPTTLRSRDEDLVAPWYLWLNRREPDTDYQKLEPLEFNVDGMHILRWYGIAMARRPDCPCCGDFVGEGVKQAGITLSPEELAEFGNR